MRIRIKTIKAEKVSSSSAVVRHQLQKAHTTGRILPVVFRKEGFNVSIHLKKEEQV